MSGRKKRDNNKRLVAHSIRNLRNTQQHLAALWTQFQDVHPEHAELLSDTIQMCYLAEQSVLLFAKNTFGYLPDDFDTWRDEPW